MTILRANCGVFDEGSGRCLACGETKEGPQCHVVMWSQMEALECSAQFYGITTMRTDYESKLGIITDSAVYKQHGSYWNPLRTIGQAWWLLERLMHSHGYTLNYHRAESRYHMITLAGQGPMIPNGSGERYALFVRHPSLAYAITLAAIKIRLTVENRSFPKNIDEDIIP